MVVVTELVLIGFAPTKRRCVRQPSIPHRPCREGLESYGPSTSVLTRLRGFAEVLPLIIPAQVALNLPGTGLELFRDGEIPIREKS